MLGSRIAVAAVGVSRRRRHPGPGHPGQGEPGPRRGGAPLLEVRGDRDCSTPECSSTTTSSWWSARETAQRFTGLGDAVSGIAVRVDDPERAPQIGEALEQRLGYPYRGPRLADPELEPVQRAPAREAGDGADYLLHHGGGGVQHRGDAHHGGHRQDPGDRHPARHGADRARGRAGVPDAGRGDRRRRHRAGPGCSGWPSRTWWTRRAGSASIRPSTSSTISRCSRAAGRGGRRARQLRHRRAGHDLSVPLRARPSRRSRRSATNERHPRGRRGCARSTDGGDGDAHRGAGRRGPGREPG